MTSVQAGKGPAKDSVLVGKYRVEATLGFGGMGLVIRAHNMALDERVAIKFLREDVNLDEEHVERFLREAKAAVRLKSEHVAKIRDVGTLEDGRPFMVMELLEGLDLGKLLIDHGSIEAARAVDLMLQACDALAEAHALGIIHRDIKPTNLFLTRRRDDSELLKVLDFGISKVSSSTELSLTQTSSMLGTPAYMSPEQMRSARTADPRSDIWALGTVLYELVEGRLPFDANNFAELCVMVSTEDPGRMTKAPELEAVMARCLAKPLEQRFQDCGELAAQLAPFSSNPERANRQVARIQRVLGTAGPASRDSTPIPMSRESLQRMGPPTRDSIQRLAGIPATPGPVRPELRGGAWKSVVLLMLLFGIGIAAGLYVTSSDSTPRDSSQAATPGPEAGVVGIDASAIERSGSAGTRSGAGGGAESIEPVDAAAAIEPDASVPDTGSADSGSAHSLSTTPPKKPPQKKPPPKKPPGGAAGAGTGSGSGSGAGSGSATKRCDPYANSKGCK